MRLWLEQQAHLVMADRQWLLAGLAAFVAFLLTGLVSGDGLVGTLQAAAVFAVFFFSVGFALRSWRANNRAAAEQSGATPDEST